MNTKVGQRRILKLADFMETVPSKRFNFAHFVGEDWKGANDLSCGTTACALGWATVMPLFRKLGLMLEWDDSTVRLNGNAEWRDMAEELFAIPYEAMQALFQPDVWGYDQGHAYHYELYGEYPTLKSDATPKQWAKHARRIVEILREEEREWMSFRI